MKLNTIVKNLLLGIIVSLLISCATTRPPIFVPPTPPPVKAGPAPRVALVLGAGNARGIAHLGVLKVLQENHIPVDLILGSNSGAIVGVMYASNPNIKTIRKTLLHHPLSDLINTSTLEVIEGGNGPNLQNFILHTVRAKNFSDLNSRFVAVATDLHNGQSISIQSGPIAPAINAACALPPYFNAVKLYGYNLVDSTLTNPTPVDVAQSYRPKIIIAVDIAATLSKVIPTNIITVYDRGFQISDQKLNQFTAQHANVIIHPDLPAIDNPDLQQNLAMIKAGEIAAKAALPQICAELQKYNIASDCSHTVIPVIKPPTLRSKTIQIFNKFDKYLKVNRQDIKK